MTKVKYFLEQDLVFTEKPKTKKFIDLTGQDFNRLTVVGYSGRKKKQPSWYCRCNCGNITSVQAGCLKNGKIKSCGCLNVEKVKQSNTSHGHSRGGMVSSTYASWSSMLSRCQDVTHKSFHHYGGRGITVCERWQKFENFLADMGVKPKGKTLDRKENDKGYCPENCRWATMKEQCNNRRSNRFITFDDKTLTLSMWADKMGVSKNTLYYRIKMGWTVEKALSTPVNVKT